MLLFWKEIDKDAGYGLSILGYPNEEQKYGDEIVYIWGKKSWIVYAPAAGYVGKAPVRTVNNDCTIRIVSDSRGIIKLGNWVGREQGCQSYTDKLLNYYKQFE